MSFHNSAFVISQFQFSLLFVSFRFSCFVFHYLCFIFKAMTMIFFPALAPRPLLLPFVVERMNGFDAMRCGAKAYHATKQPNERCFVCEMFVFF